MKIGIVHLTLLVVLIIPIGARWLWAADPEPSTQAAQAEATTQPSPSNAAPQPASRELLAEVQNNLHGIDALEADFDQVKNLAVFNHKLNLSGHFAMKKPDWIIWVVDQPVRYAIRVEGEEVRQWDQDTNQVQVIHIGGDPTFKAVSEQLQAWLLGNYKALEGSYDVYVLANKPAPLSLRFVPKSTTMFAKLIKSIDVTFSKDGKNVEAMTIQESSGDWTSLTIKNPRINQPINPRTWEIPPQ